MRLYSSLSSELVYDAKKLKLVAVESKKINLIFFNMQRRHKNWFYFVWLSERLINENDNTRCASPIKAKMTF